MHGSWIWVYCDGFAAKKWELVLKHHFLFIQKCLDKEIRAVYCVLLLYRLSPKIQNFTFPPGRQLFVTVVTQRILSPQALLWESEKSTVIWVVVRRRFSKILEVFPDVKNESLKDKNHQNTENSEAKQELLQSQFSYTLDILFHVQYFFLSHIFH